MIETIEVAFAPCGIVNDDGLAVSTKLPVFLRASLTVNGRTVPLTVKEPKMKMRSRIPALRGTCFMDRVVVHSSELNP